MKSQSLREVNFSKAIDLIKEMKENEEVELKVTRQEILKKFEQSLEIFLQDIPKKKEKPPFSLNDEADII